MVGATVNIEDFGAPKRPQSAYFLWIADNRAKIQTDLQTKSVGEVGKEAGARWKAADAATVLEYHDKAAKAKAEYEKAMAAFEKTDAFDDWKAAQKKAKQGMKATKRGREEGEPKRPQAAFFLWFNEVGRDEQHKICPYVNMSASELGRLCGDRWRYGMSDVEKKPWEDRAAKAKAEYQKAMKEFKAKRARS